ncbi:hypothetical protein [Bacillus sp. FJAT-44742]|uniref:hypothetical protein n=1 Tax=Bacillus sp. FJAT-44742 TaxID=2014005 RepID=UPI000C23BD96|nr:hypothetical protein [Bacillus sp. FJAT-44742]
MKLIPFENTWPYDKMMEDIYLNECPYCHQHNVLTHMSVEDLERAKEEIKTNMVLPCCHTKMIILKADEDYFWTTDHLRK